MQEVLVCTNFSLCPYHHISYGITRLGYKPKLTTLILIVMKIWTEAGPACSATLFAKPNVFCFRLPIHVSVTVQRQEQQTQPQLLTGEAAQRPRGNSQLQFTFIMSQFKAVNSSVDTYSWFLFTNSPLLQGY